MIFLELLDESFAFYSADVEDFEGLAVRGNPVEKGSDLDFEVIVSVVGCGSLNFHIARESVFGDNHQQLHTTRQCNYLDPTKPMADLHNTLSHPNHF